MLRKITVAATLTVLLAGVATAAFSAGASSRAGSGSRVPHDRLARTNDFGQVRATIKSCPSGNITLRCVNKNFNKLRKAFNSLVLFVNNCLSTKTFVTQYGDPGGSEGYNYDDTDGGIVENFDTTALDFTVTGDTPSAQLVTTAC